MTQKKKKKEQHLLCRPPKGATEVERWTGKAWKKDDGKPGLAFSYIEGLMPVAGATECCEGRPRCQRFTRPGCPKDRAMDRTCDRWGCANGHDLPPFKLQVAR